MIKLKKIQQTISNYNELITLVESKIKLLESLDSYYSTTSRIEKISFDKGLIYVTCDDCFMDVEDGCLMGTEGELYFNFPIKWLVKTDDELTKIVLAAKEVREKKERKKLKDASKYLIIKKELESNKNTH